MCAHFSAKEKNNKSKERTFSPLFSPTKSIDILTKLSEEVVTIPLSLSLSLSLSPDSFFLLPKKLSPQKANHSEIVVLFSLTSPKGLFSFSRPNFSLSLAHTSFHTNPHHVRPQRDTISGVPTSISSL